MHYLGKFFCVLICLLSLIILSSCTFRVQLDNNDVEINEYVHEPTPTSPVHNINKQIEQRLMREENIMSEDEKSRILKYANNDTPADELITKISTGNGIKYITTLRKFSTDILSKRPCECVRYSEETNGRVYFIYKCGENDYEFILYNSIEADAYPWVWVVGKRLYLKDFENLLKKNATIDEVMEFDKNGNYTSLSAGTATSTYTYHFTVEGDMIRLDYDEGRVNRLTVFSGEENPIYHNLLPVDKELIKRLTQLKSGVSD